MKRIIIVGAGIAGLSFAYECLVRKHQVLLVESAGDVGGLAKSIFHHDCFLDIGVHVMYLKDRQVSQKVHEIVDHPSYWIKIHRRGKLYLKGTYIDWPFTPRTLFQLPFSLGLQIVSDQIRNATSRFPSSSSFEDTLLHLYGPTLYRSFFSPLTKKFLHIAPKRVHSDWAFASLRGATKIEDTSFSSSHTYHTQDTGERAKKEFNVFTFLIRSLLTRKTDEPFYYFRDGFGMMAKEYEKKILKLGGVIATHSTVTRLHLSSRRISHCVVNDTNYPVDVFVWTANPAPLCTLLGLPPPDLPFLHSKYVYVFLKKPTQDFQVCYYADPAISFLRASIFSNHSPTIIRNPDVASVVCLEYSFPTLAAMNRPFQTFSTRAIRDMKTVGLIHDRSAIDHVFELNVPRSYPLLTLDYRDRLSGLSAQFQQYPNLLTIGRQATFSYNNTDTIIKEVLNHPIFGSRL